MTLPTLTKRWRTKGKPIPFSKNLKKRRRQFDKLDPKLQGMMAMLNPLGFELDWFNENAARGFKRPRRFSFGRVIAFTIAVAWAWSWIWIFGYVWGN